MTKSKRQVKGQIEIRLAVEHSALLGLGRGFGFQRCYGFRIKEKYCE